VIQKLILNFGGMDKEKTVILGENPTQSAILATINPI
jgi:hypothetical protein